jgi:hypothetical protein
LTTRATCTRQHPHTFAADRAEAVRLLATLPAPLQATLDLWTVVGELTDI